MGRRKNNPELVQELIDGRWDMDQDEFEEKYYSLSSSDMSKVADAIDGMDSEWDNGIPGEDNDSDEGLNVWDAADIWSSSGEDEDYTFGYSEDELRDARD